MKFLWLSHVDKSEREGREKALTVVKQGLIKCGTKLSELLIDFLFVASNGEEGEIMNVSRLLRAALEPKIHVENRQPVVFDRIFKLLETAENEVKKRLRWAKMKGKLSPEKGKGGPVFIHALVGRLCRQIVELQAVLSALPQEEAMSLNTIKRALAMAAKRWIRSSRRFDHYSLLVFVKEDLRAWNRFLQVKMAWKVCELWFRQKLDE